MNFLYSPLRSAAFKSFTVFILKGLLSLHCRGKVPNWPLIGSNVSKLQSRVFFSHLKKCFAIVSNLNGKKNWLGDGEKKHCTNQS